MNVWQWEDLSQRGRDVYVWVMAVAYLRRDPKVDLPSGLVKIYRDAVVDWKKHPDDPVSAAEARILKDDLPPSARFSSKDEAKRELDQWESLALVEREYLVLRLALTHVSNQSESVPGELVAKLLHLTRTLDVSRTD